MKYIFTLLTLVAIGVWLAVFQLPDNNLHIIACDVGQGDAILAIYGKFEILTDGGIPNGKALECLSKYLPFYDREIEVIVNTHPQLDHYGGLTEVFKRYKVDYFIANGLSAGASEYQALRKEVGGGTAVVVNPNEETTVRAGLMSYDIFWPARDFLTAEGYDFNNRGLGTFTSKRDPNDFSVQAILSFGKFGALLTGDIGENMSGLVSPYIPNKTVQYIKVPHHGSRYGLTPDYIKLFMPKVGVISVGKKNTYGHPTKEILDLLSGNNIKTFRTDEIGDVEIVSDGENYWKKK